MNCNSKFFIIHDCTETKSKYTNQEERLMLQKFVLKKYRNGYVMYVRKGLKYPLTF